MSIMIQLLEDERLLKVKLLDFLKIRDLVDMAQNVDKNGRLIKQLPYDPPERKQVCQKSLTFQSDIWALGVVIFEYVISMQMYDDSFDLVKDLNLRELSYEMRTQIIEKRIQDVALKQLLKLMLKDEADRPTATQLLQHPTV